MAFTVNEFQDMLVILDQHPEWRLRLLVVLLRDDVIEPPAHLERLAPSAPDIVEQASQGEPMSLDEVNEVVLEVRRHGRRAQTR